MRPWHRTTDHSWASIGSPASSLCFNEAVAQNHGSRPRAQIADPEAELQ